MRLRVMRRREVCTDEAVLAAGSALASVLLDASTKIFRVRAGKHQRAEACSG